MVDSLFQEDSIMLVDNVDLFVDDYYILSKCFTRHPYTECQRTHVTHLAIIFEKNILLNDFFKTL